MQIGFSIIGAKRDETQEDAPAQQSMRASAAGIRRNPSTDQKKVRRQMTKQAWTADGSDITPMAQRLMDIADKASDIDAWNSDMSGYRESVEAFLAEQIKPILSQITQADRDVLEDYNYHVVNRAIDRAMGKTASRKTAASNPSMAPTKWREQLDRREYSERYDPRNDSDGDPEEDDPTRQASLVSLRAEAFLQATGAALWGDIHNKAHAAGMAAGNAHSPTPMIVGTPTHPLGNDIDPNKKIHYVPSGVCGFAWINLTPGTHGFVRWLRSNGIGHKSYYGGWDVWVGAFGQSMEQKEAYAGAYAEVIRQEIPDITARAQSRMD